jgi:hypothetical protein
VDVGHLVADPIGYRVGDLLGPGLVGLLAVEVGHFVADPIGHRVGNPLGVCLVGLAWGGHRGSVSPLSSRAGSACCGRADMIVAIAALNGSSPGGELGGMTGRIRW